MNSFLKVYTSKELAAIEELARLEFLPFDIARNLEVDPIDFREELKEPSSLVYRAFYKGLGEHEKELKEEYMKASSDYILAAESRIRNLRKHKGEIEKELYI